MKYHSPLSKRLTLIKTMANNDSKQRSKGLITIFNTNLGNKNIKHIESKERYIMSEVKLEDRR